MRGNSSCIRWVQINKYECVSKKAVRQCGRSYLAKRAWNWPGRATRRLIELCATLLVPSAPLILGMKLSCHQCLGWWLGWQLTLSVCWSCSLQSWCSGMGDDPNLSCRLRLAVPQEFALLCCSLSGGRSFFHQWGVEQHERPGLKNQLYSS